LWAGVTFGNWLISNEPSEDDMPEHNNHFSIELTREQVDAHIETIECAECGATGDAKEIVVKGESWTLVPSGWLVADTYPPGDDGLQFLCDRCWGGE
jgi:hypothetical protein